MYELISRQSAIDAVNGMPDCPNGYSDTYDKRHIIAVLEDVPSVPNTFNALSALDCIERQATIDALCDNCDTVDAVCAHYPCKRYISIENLPSVQTEKMQLSKEDATKGTTFDCISREDAIDVLAYFDEKDPLGHTPQQIIMALPSAQPEHLVKESCNLVKGLVNDCISRQAAIDALCEVCENCEYFKNEKLIQTIKDLPSAQESRREWYMKGYRDAQRWIPFEIREPDAEEKQEHPEWDFVLCGKLPQDGQRILVNIKYKGHEAVQMDEYNDDGRECYLHSGYDIATEATAWMPLPEPYKEEQDD